MNAITTHPRGRTRALTRESADFPTRSYDLVKEFVVALAVVTALTLVLAGIFSSPDGQPVTMRSWA